MEKLYNLQYDFVKQDRNYLVFSDSEGINNAQLNNIQAKMLLFNNVPNLLQFEIEEMDFNVKLRYDITSKMNINNYLKSIELSPKQCLQIYSDVVSIINESKLYMLEEDNYVIHQDFLFIDIDTLKISLVYLPLKKILEKEKFSLELKKFLIYLFTNTNNTDDNLFKEIMSYSEDVNYNVDDLKRKLPLLSISYDEMHKDTRQKDDTQIELNNGSSKARVGNKNRFLFFFLILLIGFMWSQYIRTENEGLLYMNLGITILIIDFIYVTLRILRPKFKEITICSVSINNEENQTNAKKSIMKQVPEPDETTLLRIDNGEICLEVDRGTEVERIIIDNKNFIIGRNKLSVNYTEKSKEISRIHIEIIQDNSGYSVKDLGSKNGSYLNEDELIPNRCYPIKVNDVIKIANTEFVVKEVSFI